MRIIRELKIASIACLILVFAWGCRRDKGPYGVELSKPSKMRDIISMFSGKHDRVLAGGQGTFDENGLKSFVAGFFDALRWQKNMEASIYISDTFFSSRYGDKRGYERFLRSSAAKSRFLKLDSKINEIVFYGDEALVSAQISGLKLYLASGIIQTVKDDVFLWIRKKGDFKAIEKTISEEKWPAAVEQNGDYRDLWMFYGLRIPKEYVFIRTKAPRFDQYIRMDHKKMPLGMYLTTLWMEGGALSSRELAQREADYLSNEEGYKLNELRKYDRKGYDAHSISYSYVRDGSSYDERRTYFIRPPLLYTIGVSGQGKLPDSVKNDYDKLLKSFRYLETDGSLSKNLRPNYEVMGGEVKNNFFNYRFSPSVDWKISAINDDIVQFRPVKKSDSSLSYIYAHEALREEGLKGYVGRLVELSRFSFPHYRVLAQSDGSTDGSQEYTLKSRLKRGFFDSSNSKSQFFVKRGDVIYELGLVTKGKNDEEHKRVFDGLLKGFSPLKGKD